LTDATFFDKEVKDNSSPDEGKPFLCAWRKATFLMC